MTAPFATASDLASRLKRTVWTGDDLAQVNTFLDDASNDLRAEIGWQVYPPVEVTVEATPDQFGHIRLPGSPIASIGAVVQGGETLEVDDYEWSGGLLHLPGYATSAVTYTVGYAAAPVDLVKWTCVLAAQALAAFDEDESLGGGTPSSRALADYRISYSERQQLGELPIPVRVLERLRSTYGQAVFAT